MTHTTLWEHSSTSARFMLYRHPFVRPWISSYGPATTLKILIWPCDKINSLWGSHGAKLSTWSLFIGPVLTPLTPLTPLTLCTHGQFKYGLTLSDNGVGVSGRVSIDTGVGVSRVSWWCQDLVSKCRARAQPQITIPAKKYM